ncbi:MAG: hypothetical protein ACFFD4_04950 [Candidatus Odinarchaeota archaeon]
MADLVTYLAENLLTLVSSLFGLGFAVAIVILLWQIRNYLDRIAKALEQEE